MPHLEIVATDGKIQRRIIWVDVKSNGVYVGLCREGHDIHWSYHTDGNLFKTINGKTEKIGNLQPLKGFQGTHQMTGGIFSKDLSKVSNVSYDLKKLDAVTYIDARTFNGDYIGCYIHIVESGRFDLLGNVGRPPTPTREFHVFLQFDPWIVIRVDN